MYATRMDTGTGLSCKIHLRIVRILFVCESIMKQYQMPAQAIVFGIVLKRADFNARTRSAAHH